jgi:hypothetical protein
MPGCTELTRVRSPANSTAAIFDKRDWSEKYAKGFDVLEA